MKGLHTFKTHATVQGGIEDTVGESRWFSDSLDPSNVHPSSCNPPICLKNIYLFNQKRKYLIGQKEYSIIYWTILRRCKKNNLMCKFVV